MEPVVFQSGLVGLENFLDLFRQREAQVIHQINIFLARTPGYTWVVQFFITDG